MKLTALTWNTEWATPTSRRTPEILRRIDEHAPDVACLTEAHEALLATAGYTITAQPDYGYRAPASRRKVLLWSKQPWQQVDDLGLASLPPGRFVSGVTQTPLGAITVVGICIPWWGCRTEAYRGANRKARWQDHEAYLDGLPSILAQLPPERLIVMGDFNQIIGPRARAPKPLQTKLAEAFPPGLPIVTADHAFHDRKTIDHIALSDDLATEALHTISNVQEEGKRLSDHFGVAATVVNSRDS